MAVLQVHVVLENVNFLWDQRDVMSFREMWNSGFSIASMSKEFKRKQIDLAVLVLDQVDTYKIGARCKGLGEVKEEFVKNKRGYEWPLTLYIALEEANFLWNENDVVRFHEMWEASFNIVEMARKLKRHQIEIAMLVLDQFGLKGMLDGIKGRSESVA